MSRALHAADRTVPDDHPVLVAPMRRRHLRGVLAIEERTNHRPWSQNLFMGELRMPTTRSYVVALSSHRVVGFCGMMITGEEAHVTNIAVDPDQHRRGIGARMLLVSLRDMVARGVDAVTLEVRMTNAAAQGLYRRFGFAPGGVRRNYYADVNEDGLIMWVHDIRSSEYGERLGEVEAALTGPLRTEGFVEGTPT